jgi:hypothetical protein
VKPDKIAEVLRLHALHQAGDPAGKRANLSGANLSGANLSRARLSRARLSWADLTWADLSGADLSGADLTWANLSGARLSRANLSGARLSGANLSRARLSRARLTWADLSGANLSGANLSGANLSGANLSRAKGGELAAACLSIVHEGEMTGWKKCAGETLVKLRIPALAARSNATGRKCRAEFAEVLSIEDVSGKPIGGHALSLYDRTPYELGKTVRCHQWEPDRWRECAGGIHFFLTREEAVDY